MGTLRTAYPNTVDLTNSEGSIWRTETTANDGTPICDGVSSCINLSGPCDCSSNINEDVWIEQILDVSAQKGRQIKIGVQGYTKSMNDWGDRAWVQMGCDGNMDSKMQFHKYTNDVPDLFVPLTKWTTCSVIQNSNCDTLKIKIGGHLGG